MILPDANLLLYAYHPRAAQHVRARQWLEAALSGIEPVALSSLAILAFLRIGTNPKAFERPLNIAEARGIVASWLDEPPVFVAQPGERYWRILSQLMEDAQVSGPLVTDAAVAALAIEHGATLYTSDRDFSRFAELKVVNPLLS